MLFMGRPGVGKTTAIRELSRLLADDLQRRVVIVDTSNEIGGDGDVPHAGIGRARRMQVCVCVAVSKRTGEAPSLESANSVPRHRWLCTFVSSRCSNHSLKLLPPPSPPCALQVPDPEQQHRVMIEAVENHMPQVVVIDEIGTEAECSAARTIAQVGVWWGAGVFVCVDT